MKRPQHLHARGSAGRSLGRSRQQRGMEWLREALRSPNEPAVARHVPQALEPSSPSLDNVRTANGAIAFLLRRAAENCGGRLSRPERDSKVNQVLNVPVRRS